MERKVLEMVLEAKRIFTYDKNKSTRELLQEYDIHYHDVIFWFQVMYPGKYREYHQGIQQLFLIQ